jgi:hypothetical protein
MKKPKRDRSAEIMRGPDGTLYLIRDEVLELCRMTKEDAASAEKALRDRKPKEGTQKGHFSIEAAAFEPLGRVQGTFTPMAVKLTRQSTIMCTWWSLGAKD